MDEPHPRMVNFKLMAVFLNPLRTNDVEEFLEFLLPRKSHWEAHGRKIG
jgi:hypothetical protein